MILLSVPASTMYPLSLVHQTADHLINRHLGKMFMMKRELGIEWNRLREEVSASELAFNLMETWSQFAKCIRSWIGRRIAVDKARLQRGYSAMKTVPHTAIVPGVVQQAETSLLTGEKQYLPSALQEPPQRRSIFPGAASLHNAKEQSKP